MSPGRKHRFRSSLSHNSRFAAIGKVRNSPACLRIIGLRRLRLTMGSRLPTPGTPQHATPILPRMAWPSARRRNRARRCARLHRRRWDMKRRLYSPPSRLASPPSRWKEPPKRKADHYGTPEHRAWERAVKERAGFRCEQCGNDQGRMYADHIQEIRDAPHLALDLSNGQCLCSSCHGRKTASEARRRAQGEIG